MPYRAVCLTLLPALLLTLLLGCSRLSALRSPAAAPLHFRADGTFKIVTFGDIHWDQNNEQDKKTLALMEMILEAEKPDLVIYTGDNCLSAQLSAIAQGYRDLSAPAVKRGIPWAATLGNHDGEAGNNRKEHYAIMLQAPGTLAQRGPRDIYGSSNYTLPIASSTGRQTKALLYFLDSNAYGPKDMGYDWIHPDQVQWYRQTAAGYKQANGGVALPAYAFFHIPLPEYSLFWEKGTHFGEKFEGIASAQVNSGLYAAMREAGDVKGVFVGHDHINAYSAYYYGLWMSFVRGIGFNTYGGDEKNNFKHGARVIELREGQRAFTTWQRIEGNQVVNQGFCY